MMESNGRIPIYLNRKVDDLIDWFVIYKNLPDQERSNLVKQSYDDLYDFLSQMNLIAVKKKKKK